MPAIEENYLALTVSILAKCPPEAAFLWLTEGRPKSGATYRHILTLEDIQDMAVFRAEGITYRIIGEMYGISESAVYNRLRRHEGRI